MKTHKPPLTVALAKAKSSSPPPPSASPREFASKPRTSCIPPSSAPGPKTLSSSKSYSLSLTGIEAQVRDRNPSGNSRTEIAEGRGEGRPLGQLPRLGNSQDHGTDRKEEEREAAAVSKLRGNTRATVSARIEQPRIPPRQHTQAGRGRAAAGPASHRGHSQQFE